MSSGFLSSDPVSGGIMRCYLFNRSVTAITDNIDNDDDNGRTAAERRLPSAVPQLNFYFPF